MLFDGKNKHILSWVEQMYTYTDITHNLQIKSIS